MPFGTITVNSATYEPRQPGIYSKSGLTFDAPSNELRIRGASRSGKVLSAGVTKVLQKDVSTPSGTVRKTLPVTLSFQLEPDSSFTAADIDSAAIDISEFLTPATISRMLQGES